MLICVPSTDDGELDAPVSGHFGRAPNYSLVETTTERVEVIDNDGQHHGGGGSPPQIVADTGADALVCGNLGQKAVERFDALDIEVYCGAEGTVRDAVAAFEAGDLDRATPDGSHCSGHGDGLGSHGDHEHGHAHGEGHDH